MDDNQPIPRTESEWKKKLTPEQYRVLRQKGTEAAFSGKYYYTNQAGMYVCAACGNVLFSSEAKFDSGTGWPSFDKPASQGSIKLLPDNSYGMSRTEVVCGKCGSHLGHVFNDGPTPSGQRFCMNSCAMDLQSK